MKKKLDPSFILIKNLAVPLIILFILSFVSIVGVLFVTTQTLNKDEFNNSRHRMKYEMDSIGTELGQIVKDYSYWDDSVENLVNKIDSSWADDHISISVAGQFGIDYVIAVNNKNEVLYSASGNSKVKIDLDKIGEKEIYEMLEYTRLFNKSEPVSTHKIIQMNNVWSLVATSVIMPNTEAIKPGSYKSGYALIFIKKIDDALLAEIGDRSLLLNLHIDTTIKKNEIYWEIPTKDGAQKLLFVWTAKKPGNGFLYNSIPWIIAVFLLMFIFGIRFWRATAKAEAALFKANEQFSHMLKMEREMAFKYSYNKSKFLSNMSHEIKTPLNSILGFVQIIKMQNSNLSDEDKENLQYIEKAGNHLLFLINDVADMTKIEEGGLNVSIEKLDLDCVIIEAVALVKNIADAMKIEIINNQPKKQFNVFADHFRLKQVVVNLLSNAIKYNKVGGKVIIDYLDSDNKICLTIQDTGVGMQKEYLDKIFEPFMRIERTNKVEGTGIGLSITKKLLELMDATITVKSEIDKGTEMIVSLVKADKSIEITKSKDNQAGLNMPLLEKYMRVLKVVYVEDNRANIALMQKFISIISPNINLLIATSAEQGYELIVSEIPDIILTDIHLPGMSGHMLLEQIRENDILKDIPVIAISANLGNDMFKSMREEGFYEFISKPFNVFNLSDLFKKLDAEVFNNRGSA